jgi:microcystin degradation protein MlrC
VKSQFDDFTIQRGDEMLIQAGTNTAIGGVLEELHNHTDIEVVPVISARASSGGPLSAAGWDKLNDVILGALADTVTPATESISPCMALWERKVNWTPRGRCSRACDG